MMWKPPDYDHAFDTEFYDYPLSSQWYIWVTDYSPGWTSWLYRRVDNASWWFKHRFVPKHRYHILNTGLGYGFRDSDLIMEAILVKLLIEFVEQQDPFNHFDTSQSEYFEMWIETRELYEFFKKNDFRKLSHDDLTPWLNRIVAIRGHMWT